MGRKATPDKARRILDAARNSFNVEGIRAVSADSVVDRSGVAKMTLYRYFPTKEDLAAAYVHDRSDQWMKWLRSRVDALGRTPKQRLLVLFDVLAEWFKSKDYYGCPFHRAAAEFPDVANPIHAEVRKNKQQLRAYVVGLLSDAGFADREVVANQLLVLMAGAEIMANIEGSSRYALLARRMAATLLHIRK